MKSISPSDPFSDTSTRSNGLPIMAKPKQGVKKKLNDNNNLSDPEMNLLEDSWVIVKKQKVTILIPPLPVKRQKHCTGLSPKEPQLQARARKAISGQLIYTDIQTVPLTEVENSMSSSSDKAIPSSPQVPSSQPNATVPELPRPGHRTTSESPRGGNSKCHRMFGVSNAWGARRRQMGLLNAGLSLNPKMRALILERKIRKAGGLGNWLGSLGLHQFVKIFQRKNIGKFHLMNMTMKKLKDMGADAVGPRRKLMHAIDCLCQPNCFQVIQ